MNDPVKGKDDMNTKDEFIVKITGPGLTLERPVPADRVHHIINLLLHQGPTASVANEMSTPEPLAVSPGRFGETSPKMFMAEKRPKTDMQRVTCLAFFLTHHRGTQYFKTRDLTDLNKEAAQPQMSNATVAVRNATNHQYLALAGGGSKQITARGEAMVEALPDHEKVKSALEQHPLAGRKRNTNTAKSRKNVTPQPTSKK